MAASAANWLPCVSLPPKPPPMRRTLTVDGMDGTSQRMADHVLHLARVLRRGPDGDLVVLAGNGERDVAFEIEMLLAADAHLAPCSRRGALSIALLRIAALQRQRRMTSGLPFSGRARRCRSNAGRSRYSIFAWRAAWRAASRFRR